MFKDELMPRRPWTAESGVVYHANAMKTPIRIIAGLGNPEDKYERTLHNAGFWFVDALARKYGGSFRYDKKFDADYCRINLHGEDVKVDELLVAHDEIDLPPGTTRLKKGGGHGGHNGLRDIIRHCGADFVRLRLGVGHPGEKSQVTNYVLKRGTADVERAIEDNIDDAMAVMPLLIEDGLNAATKALHTREK